MVAPTRFELVTGDPESPMLDRYTTGLCLWERMIINVVFYPCGLPVPIYENLYFIPLSLSF